MLQIVVCANVTYQLSPKAERELRLDIFFVVVAMADGVFRFPRNRP